MYINGIGVVCAHGRGIESFSEALCSAGPSEAGLSVRRADLERIKDPLFASQLRRTDRFTRMAVYAAHDACTDAGLAQEGLSKLGIILATGYGPHPTTFKFLDDILTYKEADVSPTTFSHSVHNAALSYISLLLGTRGPTLTVADFAFGFEQALLLAQCWLDAGRLDHVLVGAAEEKGEVMEQILLSRQPAAVPGEGSVFALVSNLPQAKHYCRCQVVRCADSSVAAVQAPTFTDVSLSRVVGEMPVISGFTVAAAALACQRQQLPAVTCLRQARGKIMCIDLEA